MAYLGFLKPKPKGLIGVAFPLGLLAGALGTLGLWQFNLSTLSSYIEVVHVFSAIAWWLLAIPASMLERLLGGYGGFTAADATPKEIAMMTVLNALLFALVCQIVAWLLVKLAARKPWQAELRTRSLGNPIPNTVIYLRRLRLWEHADLLPVFSDLSPDVGRIRGPDRSARWSGVVASSTTHSLGCGHLWPQFAELRRVAYD